MSEVALTQEHDAIREFPLNGLRPFADPVPVGAVNALLQGRVEGHEEDLGGHGHDFLPDGLQFLRGGGQDVAKRDYHPRGIGGDQRQLACLSKARAKRRRADGQRLSRPGFTKDPLQPVADFGGPGILVGVPGGITECDESQRSIVTRDTHGHAIVLQLFHLAGYYFEHGHYFRNQVLLYPSYLYISIIYLHKKQTMIKRG